MAQNMLQRTLRDFLQEIEDAISSDRIDDALGHCQSILASFPESLEAQRLLGEIYLAQGRLEEALHSFDWVLTNDPENVIAYCNRAMVSERMSDYETALDCYQQAYELSRGNSQIRQEFNQLSAKTGQQGFMFSRAGLARLYMRGDLLAQAIQEWETVLAVAPDRLDARIGLMETCWRDGSFERVEQLATQIIQQAPGCIKALLLLAHVSTIRGDSARARSLLQQVGKLDPDLMMAQELFADLLASQPNDEFCKLLRKDPTVVDLSSSASASASATSSTSMSSPNLGSGSSSAGSSGADYQVSLDALSEWGNIEGWSNDTTLVKPKKESGNSGTDHDPFAGWPAQNIDSGAVPNTQSASLAGLGPADQSLSGLSSWSIPSSPQSAPSSGEPEPWQLLQEALNGMPNMAAQPLPDELPSWEAGANSSSPIHTMSGDHWSMPPEQKSDLSASSPNWGISSSSSNWSASSSSSNWSSLPENPASGAPSSPSWSMPGGETTGSKSSPSWSMPGGEPTGSKSSPSWSMPGGETTGSKSSPSWSMPGGETTGSKSSPSWSMPGGEPTGSKSSPSWSMPGGENSYTSMASSSSSWSLSEEKNDGASAPDWLNMLSQSDRLQMSGAMPAIKPTTPEPEVQKPASSEPQRPAEETQAAVPPWAQEEEGSSASGEDEDEELLFGPAWLKSLGATAFDEESSASSEAPSSPASEQPVAAERPAVATPEPSTPSVVSEIPEEPSVSVGPEQEASEPDWTEQLQHESWHAPSSPSSPAHPAQVSEPAASYQPWQEEHLEAAPPSVGSEPTYTFWQSSQAEAEAPALDTWKPSQPEPVNEPEAIHPSAFEAWKPYEGDASAEAEKVESNLLSTLEELELQLRSKGFVSLEPNSLASIARAEVENNDAEITAPDPQGEPPATPEQEPFSASARQPALNESGHGSGQAAPPDLAGASASFGPAMTPAEPQWLRELRSSSVSSTPAAQSEVGGQHNMPATPSGPLPSSQPVSGPSHYTDPVSGSAFEPTPVVSSPSSQPATPATSATRGNPFMEGELETTMKRPAVRLQAMQRMGTSRGTVGRDGVSAKARASERKEPVVSKSAEVSGASLSYKERLVKGYQCQLVGSYDDAMQEYRIIIRSAPELLGEVVSNVRALLKIAPRYSAGYRVLGDAYMRQGEYLQAMESYNKALTMAKKGKS